MAKFSNWLLAEKFQKQLLLLLVIILMEFAFEHSSYALSWEVDQSNSQVLFQTQGSLQVDGGFKSYDAKINGDLSGDTSSIGLKINILASSISTGSSIQETYLKGEDFFKVQQYPEINFQSTKVIRHNLNHGTVYGNLTIRGITNPIKFEVSLEPPQYDAQSHMISIRVTADSSINRNTWGMDTYIPGVSEMIKIKVNGILKAHSDRPVGIIKALNGTSSTDR